MISFVASLLQKESAVAKPGGSVSTTINGNFTDLNTVRNISLIQRSISRTMQRPSSGLEINQASEGPAELVISEQMRSQIGSLTQQIKNLESNINRNNAADSAIAELRDKLSEIRSVAVAAANTAAATPEAGKAQQLQTEDLVATFNEQLANAEYAGQKLLGGSSSSLYRISPLGKLDVATPDMAAETLEKIDEAGLALNAAQEAVGAQSKNYYQSTVRSLQVASKNLTASESQVRDSDYGLEQAVLLKQLLQQQSGLAALSQGNLTSDAVFKLLNA
jgi:flagellin